MSQISEEHEQQPDGGFTPGPWEIFTDGDGVAHVCAVDRGYITTPERERDATLIAAAPDLLQALVSLVTRYASVPTDQLARHIGIPTTVRHVVAARAAIARATGAS